MEDIALPLRLIPLLSLGACAILVGAAAMSGNTGTTLNSLPHIAQVEVTIIDNQPLGARIAQN